MRFARLLLLAEGKSATEAYKNAGYAPNDGNAARLKGNEMIRARVSELQECAAAHATVTLEGLIDEAADIQTKAMADGKYSAAVAALTVKAKLAGLWVDKAENKANNVVYHIADHPSPWTSGKRNTVLLVRTSAESDDARQHVICPQGNTLAVVPIVGNHPHDLRRN